MFVMIWHFFINSLLFCFRITPSNGNR